MKSHTQKRLEAEAAERRVQEYRALCDKGWTDYEGVYYPGVVRRVMSKISFGLARKLAEQMINNSTEFKASGLRPLRIVDGKTNQHNGGNFP